MATIWNTTPKRSTGLTGRKYDVAGLLYNVSGTLYQGTYDSTVWANITKQS